MEGYEMKRGRAFLIVLAVLFVSLVLFQVIFAEQAVLSRDDGINDATNASGNKPTVTTGSATGVTSQSATLNKKMNAHGLSTKAWFEYGTTSGTYTNKTPSKTLQGTTNKPISADITELTTETKYYYRIVAKNSAGTSYGKERALRTK
jgi:hypothetical protein